MSVALVFNEYILIYLKDYRDRMRLSRTSDPFAMGQQYCTINRKMHPDAKALSNVRKGYNFDIVYKSHESFIKKLNISTPYYIVHTPYCIAYIGRDYFGVHF